MSKLPLPPESTHALMQRADRLAGRTIGELADNFSIPVPDDLKVRKGWQGQFLEQCLGADSGNLSQPDFNHLGIELKTLPIDHNGRILESTYVCVLNLVEHQLLQWHQSAVYKKLKHVLWVPIVRQKGQNLTQSYVATPFLWQPTTAEENQLKQDWQDVMHLVSLGQIDKLNARHGEVLQVRPKAANSRVTTRAFGSQGQSIKTLPRGFYLRSQFTQQILNYSLKVR